MTSGALTPRQALAYLGELSPGVREAEVLSGDGTVMARGGHAAPTPPPLDRVTAHGPTATVTALVPPGPLAALARIDAQNAAAAVRDRC